MSMSSIGRSEHDVFQWCDDHRSWDNIWVTLWLVILANHNVTRVQRNQKMLSKKNKKDTYGIVIGQYHNVINHNTKSYDNLA